MIYGLIIAAGKQTRFNSDKPKALADINGKCLLDANIEKMSKYCDEVKVVCSVDNYKYFKGRDNLIVINSGKGSGDAIMKALLHLDINDVDTCFVQWGDSSVDDEIYKASIDSFVDNEHIIIPCMKEDIPYVKFEQFMSDYINVYFSKYGEDTSNGYHDASLFYGSIRYLLRKCNDFYNMFYNGESYIHQHKNEFEFLDVFNDVHAKGIIVDVTNSNSFSFNTIEELNNISI